MNLLQQIFESGYAAYWDAYPASSNHYKRGTPHSKSWAKGWLTARKEDLRLNGKAIMNVNDN
jgi:hypothetical protein